MEGGTLVFLCQGETGRQSGRLKKNLRGASRAHAQAQKETKTIENKSCQIPEGKRKKRIRRKKWFRKRVGSEVEAGDLSQGQAKNRKEEYWSLERP